MSKGRALYRENFPLISVFMILVSISLVAGLYIGLKNTEHLVENEFKLDKSEVLDSTMRRYNRLLIDSIPTISYYNGFLDSASFSPLVKRYFKTFPFIDNIVFYNLQVSNHKNIPGIKIQNLTFSIHDIINYFRLVNGGAIRLFHQKNEHDTPNSELLSKCSESIYNFAGLISDFDTTHAITDKDVYRNLYKVSDLKISYMNTPGKQEIKNFRELMYDTKRGPSAFSQQDLIYFGLNPLKINILNIHPRLYDKILITAIPFDSLRFDPDYITTSIALPKGFSDYQLYFISSHEFLRSKVIRSFIPNASIFVIVYILTILIAFLIYRNLNVNSRLFKLQYDFINNFTHEFKTPVSVIKIAGNNIKSGEFLSDRELQHYGNILDEEADKLNDLMNRLLSFTQLENRSIPLKKENINMEYFLAEVISAYEIKHPDFKITFKIEKVPFINTDKILLNSIFTNLADNAYKYSYPERKELNIQIKKVKRWMLIRFIDKGIGIPNKELNHIFNKFYKVENEFNQQGSVGIGLAFCKEIIQFMHGELTVHSELEKGTEFIVKLPLFD